MGFMMKLMTAYLVLLIADVFAFFNGLRWKNWIPFILITIVIVSGIIVLGFLWITSPM